MSNNDAKSAAETGVEKSQKSVFREYAEAIVIALLLALFIRTFIVQAFKIPSGSMEETLLIGDHIIVTKYSYGLHIPNEILLIGTQLFRDIVLFQKVPERGDIIVFKFPRDEKRDFIKRVIGVPGDILEVRRQQVFLNGKPYEDPHARHTRPPPDEPFFPRDDFGPVRVPEGHVFVMGDNRENSEDSRFWGFLDITKIRGKAQFIYWSWNGPDSSIRFERFGRMLD